MSNNNPAPSTQKNISEAGFVPPHSDSHSEEGGDPVLPQIRYLGQATITPLTTTGSSTFVDITGSSIKVQTRGGIIRLTYSGELDFTAVRLAPDANNSILLGGYIQAVATPTNGSPSSLGTRSFASSSTLTNPSTDTFAATLWAGSANLVWYATLAAGEYTFKLQFKMHAASTATILYVGGVAQDPFTGASETAYLTVEEVLPIRRA